MKIRAMETITISNVGVPVIEGYTLNDWKALLYVGIERCVREGRNLYDWDTYEGDKRWVKVGPQPEHKVDQAYVYFHSYKHGGRVELQAVYYFEVEQ